MKKTYQKPVMIALSLTGNEQLCGSCSIRLRDDVALNTQLAWLTGDDNGILTKEEVESLNFFGANEACTQTIEGFESYCKFTGGTNMIAWS